VHPVRTDPLEAGVETVRSQPELAATRELAGHYGEPFPAVPDDLEHVRPVRRTA
jgi:hypothetical protein